MRWYYLSHFTRYRLALEKIPLYTMDKHDALGDQMNQRGVSRGHEVCFLLTNPSSQVAHPKVANLLMMLSHLADVSTFSSVPLLPRFLPT